MSKNKTHIVYIDKHYGIQKCNVHKITIHYFVKGETQFNETQCWDCLREVNNKKYKEIKLPIPSSSEED